MMACTSCNVFQCCEIVALLEIEPSSHGWQHGLQQLLSSHLGAGCDTSADYSQKVAAKLIIAWAIVCDL